MIVKDGKTYTDDGTQVLLRYQSEMRQLVPIPGTKRTYVFVVQHTVCASWVSVWDAAYVLGLKGGCCGKKQPGVYTYCDEQHARRFLDA